ncbi:Ig-like domain-containing protein [Actinoplanes sp. NPDC026623]|uniref:Ig-like domain-containing protein n=1 Tax=Actinoplanes sp. NPDC026623 TaxID=3155610 RepID=UPI0033DAA268
MSHLRKPDSCSLTTAPSSRSPRAGTYLRGTLTAGVTNVRDTTGLTYLAAYLDDWQPGAHTGKQPWAVRLNSRETEDGKHTLTWDAMDTAGNITTVRRAVYIDNTAPSVRLTKAPKNKAKLTKTVKLTASASDRYGITRVQLLVNGKLVATDTKAGYHFTLNPKKYGKTFTVQLRAYDKAGNTKYTTKRTYRR